ncbi:hypothetical protein Q5P01_006805 [Channa striata]|uniref:Uncharacterized protein n=1 Tax=Channa striata TaxID=64152 RepID=A0AA88NC21_CHASR|nr:hypothetical protein Q5P01_006805 [Channa striata]
MSRSDLNVHPSPNLQLPPKVSPHQQTCGVHGQQNINMPIAPADYPRSVRTECRLHDGSSYSLESVDQSGPGATDWACGSSI